VLESTWIKLLNHTHFGKKGLRKLKMALMKIMAASVFYHKLFFSECFSQHHPQRGGFKIKTFPLILSLYAWLLSER